MTNGKNDSSFFKHKNHRYGHTMYTFLHNFKKFEVSYMRIKQLFILWIISICSIIGFSMNVHAEELSLYEERLALYQKTEATTFIPWYYIAAIDQYERNMETPVPSEQIVSITFDPLLWYGPGNVLKHPSPSYIALFNGIGQDGSGNGEANIDDPEDVLYTIGRYISSYGTTETDVKIALWNYYKRDLSVQSIMQTARVFKKFQSLELTDRTFPVSINHTYSYRNTWGDRRGFGGLRIHEGTDIFAHYGTPVYSTTYGVIDQIGWNLYGGWRIGIRDVHNIYHYYAHLQGYTEDIKLGTIVQPGDQIGTVGSSGYGPPGTSGKFPPHLHYGMYKDNGRNEWSFDPYPYLRRWEQMARTKK